MNCKKCGSPLSTGVRFCTACGSPIELQATNNMSDENQTAQMNNQNVQMNSQPAQVNNQTVQMSNQDVQMNNQTVQPEQIVREQPLPQTAPTNTVNNQSDTKAFKILSYVGILWLIGLFSKNKNDSDLKFHVGQGMILTIAFAVLYFAGTIVNTYVIAKIFRSEVTFFGYGTGVYEISSFGSLLITVIYAAIWIAQIFCMVKGIINANNNKNTELPVIGKYAFYK